jgi:hypothetical protein
VSVEFPASPSAVANASLIDSNFLSLSIPFVSQVDSFRARVTRLIGWTTADRSGW